MCCVVFNPPSNGRFRPPLSKKSVSCPPGGEKICQSGGRIFLFSQIYLFPFLMGGGVPVFRKYSHLFNVSNKQILRP